MGTFEAAWPRCLEGVGADLSPALRVFGDRFAALMPWFWQEFTRPPHTFLHGDLRLDQMFFAVDSDDPPVTALDWQLASKGRGAYDVAYFLKSVRDEVIQAFDNVERTLATAGASWRDVVSVHSYHLPDADGTIGQEHLATMADQFRRRLGDRAPLWTCVGVAALANPAMRVEIQVSAIIDREG